MTDINDEVLRRKINKGVRELNQRCHCGRPKTWHTIAEANKCKKMSKTETVGRIMTKKDIANMDGRKI